MFDDSEVRRLAADLNKAAHRAIPEISAAVKDSAKRLEKGWRDNAARTAGKHGKHYPKSITADVSFGLGSIEGEVGPDSSKPQGGMSFEFGSVNQAPHLDGQQAADVEEPKFLKAVSDAAEKALDL